MTYVEMDDELPDHEDVVGLSDRAWRMWVSSILYSSKKRSDGMIPAAMASRWAAPCSADDLAAAVQEVVAAGRWHEPGHGCPTCAQPKPGQLVVHNYARRNRTKAEIEALSEKRRAAGRAGGRRSGAVRGRTKPEASGSTTAQQEVEQDEGNESSETNPASSSQLPTAATAAEDAAAAAARLRHPSSLGAASGDPIEPAIVILRQKLDLAGLPVIWKTLSAEQRAEIVDLQAKHGDAALVRAALNSRAAHPTAPVYATAWLDAWEALPDPAKRLELVKAPRCDKPGHEAYPADGCVGCKVDIKIGGEQS